MAAEQAHGTHEFWSPARPVDGAGPMTRSSSSCNTFAWLQALLPPGHAQSSLPCICCSSWTGPHPELQGAKPVPLSACAVHWAVLCTMLPYRLKLQSRKGGVVVLPIGPQCCYVLWICSQLVWLVVRKCSFVCTA